MHKDVIDMTAITSGADCVNALYVEISSPVTECCCKSGIYFSHVLEE